VDRRYGAVKTPYNRAETMSRAVLALVVVGTVVAGGLWYRSHVPPPAPAACDGGSPPPLPAALTPSGTSITAIVAALDAALGDDHKRALRCFRDEDDLVVRAHGGFGAWLRTTLHLWSRNDTTKAFKAIGLTNADDMSEVLMRVYYRRLHGRPLAIDETVAAVRARKGAR
jgi:hypothetical protein